jgi:AbrB family transcriptional regulator (stage V sporulation protein T)
MKATGIIRRIDDLGRIVIPKEIRHTLRIKEGDPLEVFVYEGGVFYKKYSPFSGLTDFATKYAESLYETTEHTCIITDKDNIIAVAGTSKRNFLERPISNSLCDIINKNCLYISNEENDVVNIIENQEVIFDKIVVYPIISDGNIIGSVILAVTSNSKVKEIKEVDMMLLKNAAIFLGKQIEE